MQPDIPPHPPPFDLDLMSFRIRCTMWACVRGEAMTSTDNGKIRPAIYSMVVVLIVGIVLTLLVFAVLRCRESTCIGNDSGEIPQPCSCVSEFVMKPIASLSCIIMC